jgi:hypothetical protein
MTESNVAELLEILKKRAEERFGPARAAALVPEIQQLAAELANLLKADLDSGDEP